MKQVAWGLIVCIGLALAGMEVVHASIALGRVLYLLPDPNCVQVDQDPNYISFAYDKTKVVGHLIGAVDCYRKVKMNLPGDWCDPENDPVVVGLEAGPAWLTLTQDQPKRTFMLVGEPDVVGVQYVVLALADVPPDGPPVVTQATILLNVLPRPNKGPAVRIQSSNL